MFIKSYDRGWIDDTDKETMSENESYYLYIGSWYSTISPNHLWYDGLFKMFNVMANGSLNGDYGIGNKNGGVHIISI